MWIALITVCEFCVWCSSEIPALLLSHSPLPEPFHLVQLVLYAPSGLCETSCESRVIDFCRFSARAILGGARLISLTFAFLLLILLCQTQHLSQHYPPPHYNKVLSTSSSSLALSAGAGEGCYRRLCLFWQCQLSKESAELVGGLCVFVFLNIIV